MKKQIGLLLLLVSLSAASAAPSPMQGTFIQYQQWMLDITRQDWLTELEAMKQAGMKDIFLQWLQYDEHRFYVVRGPQNDPTDIVLKHAEKLGLRVHVGLRFTEQWWKAWDDPTFLKNLAALNTRFATKIWRRYGKSPAFAGWYIPFEVGNLEADDEDITLVGNFFATLATACRKLAPKLPVSASLFFTEKQSPAVAKAVFEKLIPAMHVDILLVQDGVGANNWDGRAEQVLPPYFKAIADGAAKSKPKPEVWAIIENFRTTRDANGAATGRVPGNVTGIQEQIKATTAAGVEKRVFFDFFHYMSPRRGGTQKELFEGWIRTLNP